MEIAACCGMWLWIMNASHPMLMAIPMPRQSDTKFHAMPPYPFILMMKRGNVIIFVKRKHEELGSLSAVRRSRRGRRASATNASRSRVSYGPIFFGAVDRRYAISLRTGPRSQSLIVFLDRLIRRAISLIDNPSRSRIRRTFAYIAMVCTSPSLQGFAR
jgi:hypothetical protein